MKISRGLLSVKAISVFVSVLFLLMGVGLFCSAYYSPYRSLDLISEYSQHLISTSTEVPYLRHTPDVNFQLNDKEFKTNTKGFRAQEFAPKKNPNVYRFAVVGSWIPAGLGLFEYQTISARLDAFLKLQLPNMNLGLKAEDVEFFNLAVGGNSLLQEVSLIKDVVKDLEIDAVLLLLDTSDLILREKAAAPVVTKPGRVESGLWRFSNTQDVSFLGTQADQILNNENWGKVRSLLADLRGKVSADLNIDIIPVLLPPLRIQDEDSQEVQRSVLAMLAFEGFSACPTVIEDKTFTTNRLQRELFLGTDEFNQSIAVQIVNCLGFRGLRR